MCVVCTSVADQTYEESLKGGTSLSDQQLKDDLMASDRRWPEWDPRTAPPAVDLE